MASKLISSSDFARSTESKSIAFWMETPSWFPMALSSSLCASPNLYVSVICDIKQPYDIVV